MKTNNLEKPCAGANYVHSFSAMEKDNYCDRNGKCTAEDRDEMVACRFYDREEILRPEMCISLSKLGDICMHPDALVAKLKELQAEKTGGSKNEVGKK